MNRFSVKDKNVIVTGGAQGMGAAYVTAFDEEGANVYSLDIQHPKSIESRCMHCDVAQPESIYAVFEEIANETCNQIHCLINNAGVTRRPYFETIAINLIGPHYCAYTVAEMMKRGKVRGSIINIASINASRGFEGNPGYVESKSAIPGLTRALVVDYGKYGIRANTICPAYVVTPMTEHSQNDPVLKRQRSSMIPLNHGEWAYPEDMVGCAIFLASDASSYITGATIPIDGGWSSMGLPRLDV